MGGMQRALDLAQKGAVVGLLSLFGYQVYQIQQNVAEWNVDNKYMHTNTFEKIKEKVDEESQMKDRIDIVPDRYDPEDSSYLKKVPKLDEPSKRT